MDPKEAQEHLNRALNMKKTGQSEEALTEFRRAALADPSLKKAHMEIGYLLKPKIKQSPVFQTHAFEAFRQAARLDLNDQEAHDQYILHGQQLGRLEELLKEYEKWVIDHPENKVVKRCKKNILTISMALMPTHVAEPDAGGSKMLAKLMLFMSLGLIVFGLAMIVMPLIINKTGRAVVKKESSRSLFYIAISLNVAGVGGLLVRSKLK